MKDFGGRKSIEGHQLKRFQKMLQSIGGANPFYQKKLSTGTPLNIRSLEDLKRLPFTTKDELVEDQRQHPPFGSDMTFPLKGYIRVHQTSGTTGTPLYWLDTEESWNWWAECWKVVFEAAGVHAGDRIFFPFSFGPFIGFWAGWEGGRKVGALTISGGGQSTLQRLKAIIDYQATVLVCTPTYALHMAAEASKTGIDLCGKSTVRITIHAGEPGASIPTTKKRIEEAWGAKCYDHAGATEIGAYAFECEPQPGGVHVNELEFIAEVIDPKTAEAVKEGEKGELVITNLGRTGSPVVRYRTGDLVEPSYRACVCDRPLMTLQGGVLGRLDDMVVVRGVNVFPSAIENVMREFPQVEEFRIETFLRAELRVLKLILEPRGYASHGGLGERVASRIRECLGLRPEVEVVSPGTLPRFELKSKRFFKL